MQSSKKKFDKLWSELLRLKMSNKEIENLLFVDDDIISSIKND